MSDMRRTIVPSLPAFAVAADFPLTPEIAALSPTINRTKGPTLQLTLRGHPRRPRVPVTAPEHKFTSIQTDPKLQALLADSELRKKLWGVYKTGQEHTEKWRADGKSPQMEKLTQLREEDGTVEELVRGIVVAMANREGQKK